MIYNTLKALIFFFIYFLNINLYASCDKSLNICPNVFIIENVTTLTSSVDIKITNTAPIAASIQLIANFTSGSNLCGSNYTLSPRQTITVNLECNVNSFPYSLRDIDGRSNTLIINNINSCIGKSIGQECHGGIIFYTNSDKTNGKIFSKHDIPRDTVTSIWGCGGFDVNANSETDGRSNTSNILNDSRCSGANSAVAANLCADYFTVENGVKYSNWYLPAYLELKSIFASAPYTGVTFTDDYWSSTQDPSDPTNLVRVWDSQQGQNQSPANGEKDNLISPEKANIRCVTTY